MKAGGQWAIVLGVSSGTGAACARALAARHGFNIFGMHRGNWQAAADELEAELTALGVKTWFRVADGGTSEAAEAEAKALAERVGPGRVKLFLHSIANASIGRFLPRDGRAIHPKQVEKTFTSMAHSFPYWVQSLHRSGLLAESARFVALTNPTPEAQTPGGVLIAAAKAALEQYVRYLSVELGPLGHRVNMLKFGTVVTPAMSKLLGPRTDVFTGLHSELLPAGRICTAEDVAKQVAYLATEDAEWFNGAVIDYSGGISYRAFELLVDAHERLAARGAPEE